MQCLDVMAGIFIALQGIIRKGSRGSSAGTGRAKTGRPFGGVAAGSRKFALFDRAESGER